MGSSSPPRIAALNLARLYTVTNEPCPAGARDVSVGAMAGLTAVAGRIGAIGAPACWRSRRGSRRVCRF